MSDKTNVYLAAPIFSEHHKEVVFAQYDYLVENDHAFEVFSPWHESQPIWQGRAPNDCSPEDRRTVFNGNVDNVHWAHLLSAWVGGSEDGKPDVGVIFEMGHAYGSVPILAYIDQGDSRQNMNLMLSEAVDGVAKGFDEWKAAINNFHLNKKFSSGFHPEGKITSEANPVMSE